MDDDLCDEHPKYGNIDEHVSEKSESLPFVIQDELLWGASYRHYKKKEKDNTFLPPKEAPVDVPFALCRAKQRRKRKKSTNATAPSQKSRKLSLLEKSMLTQRKYMDYLSIPNPKFEEPPPKKSKKRCELEPCPPRLVQLAVPTKRRVFENWKCYHELLPTEMIMRFEQLLHTDKNLEPRDARYYYKKIDKEKKKIVRAKRRLKRKKQKQKEKGDSVWMEEQISETVKAIMDFIREEPLFTLNFKQLMISDGILNNLDRNKLLKKPRRTTKNWYKKTLIEVSDKLALWMDTLTKFVDVQAVESEEDIPPLSISSLEHDGESEEEEESESESEGTESSAMESSGEEKEDGGGPQKIWDSVKIHYEGEDGGGEYDDYTHGGGKKPILDQLIDRLDDIDDVDILDRLIELFESSPEDFLMNTVERMPDVTYMDILNEMRTLRNDIADRGPPKSSLEQIMLDWANEVAPEKVDKKMTKAIHEFACQLGDMFRKDAPMVDGEKPIQDNEFHIPLDDLLDTVGDGGEEDHSPLGELEEIKEEDEGGHPAEELEPVAEPVFQRTRTYSLMGLQEGEKSEKGEKDDGEQQDGGVDDAGGVEVDGEQQDEGVNDAAGVEVDGGQQDGGVKEAEEVEGDGEQQDRESEIGEREGDDDQGKIGEGDESKDEDTEQTDDNMSKDTNLIIDFDNVTEGFVDTTKDDRYPEEDEGYGWPADEMATDIIETGQPTESGDVDIIYQSEESKVEPFERPPTIEYQKLPQDETRIIRGHTPSVILEHSPSTVCCLSLKIWAVWLLEITHNAHSWTKWVHEVIKQVRDFAGAIREEAALPGDQKGALKRREWLKFINDTEEKTVAWRQYSSHVKELSGNIIDNFHGKKVNCCPKCLQDHLIKNVVTAHETLQALTDAMNCAGYWQKCLDNLVNTTSTLTEISGSEGEIDEGETEEEESDSDVIFEEFDVNKEGSDEESIYEIEELNPS